MTGLPVDWAGEPVRNYGYSVRDRAFWYRMRSGLKSFYRGAERFRYALRNEHYLPPSRADEIVNECVVERHERQGGDQ